jgi:hypothetical protein
LLDERASPANLETRTHVGRAAAQLATVAEVKPALVATSNAVRVPRSQQGRGLNDRGLVSDSKAWDSTLGVKRERATVRQPANGRSERHDAPPPIPFDLLFVQEPCELGATIHPLPVVETDFRAGLYTHVRAAVHFHPVAKERSPKLFFG